MNCFRRWISLLSLLRSREPVLETWLYSTSFFTCAYDQGPAFEVVLFLCEDGKMGNIGTA